MSHNSFTYYYKSLKKVLNNTGDPLEVEENPSMETQYREQEAYALFLTNQSGVTGFLSTTAEQLTGIQQAKLFQNEVQAKRALSLIKKKHLGSAIIKVDVSFNQVLEKNGSINTTIFDNVIAIQEKEKFDSTAINEEKVIEYLMNKYSATQPELKNALESLIENKNQQVQTKAKKKKI